MSGVLLPHYYVYIRCHPKKGNQTCWRQFLHVPYPAALPSTGGWRPVAFLPIYQPVTFLPIYQQNLL
nr:unnamed protein product [Callosobruchus chinensis]